MMNDWKFLSAEKLFIVVVFFTLAGCTTTSITPTTIGSGETISSVNTTVATPPPPTRTPLTATPTPSMTPTLTPTASSTPTSIPTIAATETPFAIPTPPGMESTEQVLWLMETNNGCQLPCWWGITPGQTEWSVAQQFLSRFDSNIYEAFAPSGSIYYGIGIPLPPEIFLVDRMELGILVHEGVVERILTNVSFSKTPPGYLTQYTLSTFLNTYGRPAEVWLFTYRSPFEENDLPFVVVLYYHDQGIVVLYSDNGERQGELVQGCPQEDPVSFTSLWSPDLNLTFEQVTTDTSALDMNYLALEEATEMDVVTFYETFRQPENTTCLETPADLWR